jgi:hypothetical protein
MCEPSFFDDGQYHFLVPATGFDLQHDWMTIQIFPKTTTRRYPSACARCISSAKMIGSPPPGRDRLKGAATWKEGSRVTKFGRRLCERARTEIPPQLIPPRPHPTNPPADKPYAGCKAIGPRRRAVAAPVQTSGQHGPPARGLAGQAVIARKRDPPILEPSVVGDHQHFYSVPLSALENFYASLVPLPQRSAVGHLVPERSEESGND